MIIMYHKLTFLKSILVHLDPFNHKMQLVYSIENMDYKIISVNLKMFKSLYNYNKIKGHI